MDSNIRVGTASWTDPGFIADWYPRNLPAADRLAWYAQHFNLVEVNSSFYAIPDPRQVSRWCEQTPQDFIFDVKLHKLLSRHSTTADLLPPDLRPKTASPKAKVSLTPQLEMAVVRRLLTHLEPLADAGKLGALLLQLSPGFNPRHHHLEELEHLLELLADHPVAIEFRNRNWVEGEQADRTAEFLRVRRVTFVMVDAPPAPHFTIMPGVDLVTNPALAYLRAHGRNTQGYIRGRTVAERFDYDYSDAELREIADRSVALAAQAKELHVVYNNNASDYAPKAASRFRKIIEATTPAHAAHQ